MSFETRLADALDSYADLAPVMDDAAIARQAVLAGGGRRWVGRIEWPTTRRLFVWSVVGLLVLAALAAAILVGAALLTRPERLPGAFIPTGTTQYEYDSQPGALAVLRDGRVLFVGGTLQDGPNPGGPALGGELFDPRTNTFQLTVGRLSEPRFGPSATTLRDGRVLVAGGYRPNTDGSGIPLATAEVFDPLTGTFSPTGQMVTARAGHTATLLADGRVLIAGGLDLLGSELASAEVFDPKAGKWSDVGAMFEPRQAHTATLLPDGRVLVAGGSKSVGAGGPLATTESFDPSTGAFSPASSMTTPREHHSATLLADGRVLVVGEDSSELYDPATGRFSTTGPLVTARSGHSATLLSDGRVLVAGGSNLYGGPRSAELYDPRSGAFVLAASASGEHSVLAARLADGGVLIAGGKPELFDPAATTPIAPVPVRADRIFIATGDPVQDRFGHTATTLLDGRVLIVGGQGPGGDMLESAEIYDPRAGSFAATGSMSTSPSETVGFGTTAGHAVLGLADGRVLMLGGLHYSWELEFYDPTTGGFTDARPLGPGNTTVRGPITVVQLADGRIIAIGTPSIDVFAASSTTTLVYEVDPAGRRATRLAELNACPSVVGAVALFDDRVLVVCRGDQGGQSGRIFDPASGQSFDSAMPLGTGPIAMVRLVDGRVLYASSLGSTVLAVYDPATGQVSQDAKPLDQTAGTFLGVPSTTLTVLADGRVLILYGDGAAAIRDPTTGVTTSVPGPTAPRNGHTATLLNDGRVLVVGGVSRPPDRGDPQPPGAELFDPTASP